MFTDTVILEWLNVTAGFDAPAHWMLTHRQVVRAGWAWVGVSAQRAGIEGGSIFEAAGATSDDAARRTMVLPALKQSDPARYGALRHPGDAFCFDICLLGASYSDSGELPPAELARLMAPTAEPVGIPCPVPVNSGLQHHYLAQAAIAHLDRWARGGPPPPCSPRLEIDPRSQLASANRARPAA